MIAMDDFEQLKRQVADITQKRDKAAGALQQVMRQIKKEFGCETLEDAESKLIDLQRKERAAAETYTKKKTKFEKRWKKSLEELE